MSDKEEVGFDLVAALALICMPAKNKAYFLKKAKIRRDEHGY